MTITLRPFSAKVRRPQEMAIIDLEGEINNLADEKLKAAFETAVSDQPKSILLNFAEVDYINSTGIALIVGLLAEARKNKQKLMICGLSDHYKEIFHITRLSDFMEMFDDETAALAS